MRRIVIATAVSLWLVSLAVNSSADTLIMKDGTRVPGTVVSIVARMITFKDAFGVSHRYNANQVDSLEFTSTDRRNAAASTNGRRLEVPAGRVAPGSPQGHTEPGRLANGGVPGDVFAGSSNRSESWIEISRVTPGSAPSTSSQSRSLEAICLVRTPQCWTSTRPTTARTRPLTR